MSTWPALRAFGSELRRADPYGTLQGNEIVAVYSPIGVRQREGYVPYSQLNLTTVGGGHIAGVAALRLLPPQNGNIVYLDYHTTPGDYGAGQFRGMTTGGPYVDNGGTIIVPTGDSSKAWLRVWDNIKAHVGWFGAKCRPDEPTIDDYIPVKKCFDLFTNGRTSAGIHVGIIDVGPGFNFSQPLIYGGSIGGGFKLIGTTSMSQGGQDKSLLRYTGPKTDAAITFYGANQWSMEDINTLPGLALNGVMVTTDNTYNHTTTHEITAGSNVIVAPTGATPALRIEFLQPGCYLGVDAGGPNFEIIYITATDATSGIFIADFKKNHASGVQLGGGAPSSGGRINRCRLISPIAPVYTVLSANAPGAGAKTYTVNDITGIEVGKPLRIGSQLYQEIIYPTSVNVPTRTFEATIGNFSHVIGERVMYPTAAIYFGNRLGETVGFSSTGTVGVSEIAMSDTAFAGAGTFSIEGMLQTPCYAGVRQPLGGNTKNFTFHSMYAGSMQVPFAFERPSASGQHIISGGVSKGVEDTLFLCNGGHLTVAGWEDTSACVWLSGQFGSNVYQTTFIGCTMLGKAPDTINQVGPPTDEMFYSSGELTFIGCSLVNSRILGTTQPIIVSLGITSDTIFPATVTLIGCMVHSVTAATLKNLIRRSPGDTFDITAGGNAKFVMLNCVSTVSGDVTTVRLPDIIPANGLLEANGVAMLRAMPVVVGKVIRLKYHTTPGDLGAGDFVGKKGANMLGWNGANYFDDDGCVIVPPGSPNDVAWFRVWDEVTAHVGWFGAKCDPTPRTGGLGVDDYIPVKKCFDLFTSGRTAGGGYGGGTMYSGVIDVGPGFSFSQPLIYGGSLAGSFKLVGHNSRGRGGHEKSLLRYIGPETHAAIIFYGANLWAIEDINTEANLAKSGFLITADNTYNNPEAGGIHTTTHAITAGNNVVVTPSGATAAQKTYYLQSGVFLGVGGQSIAGAAAAGADFEIVYITAVDTTAGTFTADFKKNHPTGSLLGGGSPCSGGYVNDCRLQCPASPIWTKLTLAASGSGVKTFTVADITGIKVGYPIRVGSLYYSEVIYPTAVDVGAKTFTASGAFSHPVDALVMYPTSAIAFGNRLLGTVQVDCVCMSKTYMAGEMLERSYTGFRQIWGGNVKAFLFNDMIVSSLRCGFACEQASGQYKFNGGVSAGIDEMIWYNIAATTFVTGWEDESSAMWLTGHGGSSPSQATFIGCTMQGRCPDETKMPEAATALDEMFMFAGNLSFIGCDLSNNRIYPETLPIIVSTGVTQNISAFPSGLSLSNCTIANGTLANYRTLIRRSPAETYDCFKEGMGNITMINCVGNTPGFNVRLPNIVPPNKLWEGRMLYDPPSLAAGTVGPIVTLVPDPTTGGSVVGAVLGDLVEISFSLDLQGATLRSWVSATDTVKFQFAYPLGSTPTPLDLGSGTVKCRVKK